MTERLRGLFDDMLADEPATTVSVDDVVAAGRQEQRGRRRWRRGLVAAAAAVVLVVVGVAIRGSGSDGRDLVTDDDPSATPSSAPEATSDPSETTSTTSGEASRTTAAATSSTASTAPPPTGAPPTSSAPPAGPELLPDPGFEAGPPGWAEFGEATTLAPVAAARSGGQALAVTTTAPGPDRVVAGATNTPVVARTVPGARYTATCWARSDQPIRARVQLQEYTVDWQRAGDPTASEPVTLADPGRWYQVSVTHTATGSGNQLPLSVFTTDLFAGDAPLVVDDCSLRQP